MSSIPGAGCGICARKRIPVGAWIGPYEGKAIKPEDLTISMDTAYMWEVFIILLSTLQPIDALRLITS